MNDVNKELLKALLKVARMAEDLKKPCGMEPDSPQAIRNAQYMNISYAARDAIARADAEESMNSSMREALRYIAWECPSYSDAVECAKAAIGDEGKIVPTAPGAKIMILTAADITTPANFARATEEGREHNDFPESPAK